MKQSKVKEEAELFYRGEDIPISNNFDQGDELYYQSRSEAMNIINKVMLHKCF